MLYETNKGAFFIHKALETEWWDKIADEGKRREWHEFIPMTADEAKAWMLKGDVEVIHDRFAEGVPEAEPETEQGATIYLRVPTTLKRRVDQAANAASLSSNSWVMRCLENCLDNEAAALDRDADAVAVAAAAHKAKILARKTQRQAAAQAPVNEDKSKGSQANPGAGKP